MDNPAGPRRMGMIKRGGSAMWHASVTCLNCWLLLRRADSASTLSKAVYTQVAYATFHTGVYFGSLCERNGFGTRGPRGLLPQPHRLGHRPACWQGIDVMMQDANHSQLLAGTETPTRRLPKPASSSLGNWHHIVRKTHPSFVAIKRPDGNYVQRCSQTMHNDGYAPG